MPDEAEQPVAFDISVPSEEEDGRYANFLSVSHSEHEFTLDFCILDKPRAADDSDPSAGVEVPAKVVGRIRIAPTLVFRLLQAINNNLTKYEQRFGEIRQPSPPEEEQPE